MRPLGALALAAALACSGCASTLDKIHDQEQQSAAEAAQSAAAAGTVAAVEAAPVTEAPPLTVVETKTLNVTVEAVLHDPNATAVVVKVENEDPGRGVTWAPIAIDVHDKTGAVVATNTDGATDPTLTHMPSVAPGATAWFVDDQFPPDLGATGATAVMGGEPEAVATIPELVVQDQQIVADGPDVSFTGTVVNRSTVAQPVVIVQGIARRGNAIVAAGTAVVKDLAPGASAPFTGFFTGKAAGATYEVFAPYTAVG